MNEPAHIARHAIRRKLRPNVRQAVKGVALLAGAALLAVGAFALVATLWAGIAIIIVALFVATFVLTFARILVVPAIVAMLIAATLYLLGVVP